MKNHLKSPLQQVNWTQSGRQHRRPTAVRCQKIDCLQDSTGVGTATRRQGPQDPGIAALFFGSLQLATSEPSYGVPPVKADCQDLKPTDPMISTSVMCQLVGQ